MNGQPSFFRLAKKSFWFWFGGIWLVVGIPLTIVGVYFAAQEYRFKQSGVVAEGVVLELTQSTKGSGSDRSTSYSVRYRFTLGGQNYENRSSIGSTVWKGLREQGPVRIQCLRDDPATKRVAGGDDWVFALIGPFFGGAFAVTGAFLFLKGVRKIQLETRLYREGVPVEATVTQIKESNVSINDVQQWVVCYTYRDHQGQTHQAESSYMSPGEVDAWKVGDTGRAQFDPRSPELSMWTGREE